MDPNKRRKIEAGNAFSALQNLSRSGDSPSLPVQSSPARTPRPQVKREQNDEAGSSRAVKYSSFQLSKSNCRTRSDGVTELRLEQGDRFVVLGSFKLQVLEGEVVVAGASLRPTDDVYQIHAPHCHAIPVLRVRKTARLQLYQHAGSPALRKLGKLSPLLRGIWNEPTGSQLQRGTDATFKILCSSEDAPKKCVIQELVSPPLWNKKLAELLEGSKGNFEGKSSKVLVCGPKSAGKSTLSKILTNRLLTTTPNDAHHGVMILDLDPGQPEYGLPGTMSLVHVLEPNLSPSFTNVNLQGRRTRLVRCHTLAAVTPASNTELYKESGMDLFNTFEESFKTMPLIVNTPGWILGTGLELLEELILRFAPDEVIYMSEDGPAETVEALRTATKGQFTALPSQPTEFAGRTGAHLRAMSMMSYFHSRGKGAEQDEWSDAPLTSMRPWQVAYAGPNKGISGVISYDYQAPPNLLAESINGMVLALVEVEDAKAYRGLLEHGSIKPAFEMSPEGIPFIANPDDVTLDPRYCQTLGLALIRGIDEGFLQILTPVSSLVRIEEAKKKGRALVLLHGKFDTPDWAYKEDLYLGSSIESEEENSEDPEMEMKADATAEIIRPKETRSDREVSTSAEVPWIEILKGNEKRPLGSKVWRVRRDLGKNNDG